MITQHSEEMKNKIFVLDQKRVEAVRILQERCGFPLDEDFIHALECNFIEGVDFGRRDVNIAKEIYGYSKGAAMGRFKNPRKGVKMDRITEDIAAPVPSEIMEHYKDIRLDIDILFVNKTAFLLAILLFWVMRKSNYLIFKLRAPTLPLFLQEKTCEMPFYQLRKFVSTICFQTKSSPGLTLLDQATTLESDFDSIFSHHPDQNSAQTIQH